MVSDRSNNKELAVGGITMDSGKGVKVPEWPRAVHTSSKGAKNDPKMAKIAKKWKKMKKVLKNAKRSFIFFLVGQL